MNRGPGGFAVLIILWMLALLALIADRMIVVGRSEIRIADNLRTAAIAEAAADGAIFEGIYRLGVNGPGGWKIDGRDRHVFVGREDVTVRLEDDGMKINPNLAPAPLLQAILQQVGMPAAEARVAAGWIVAARTRAPGSATLGGKFRTLAQLAAVPGISRDIAAWGQKTGCPRSLGRCRAARSTASSPTETTAACRAEQTTGKPRRHDPGPRRAA